MSKDYWPDPSGYLGNHQVKLVTNGDNFLQQLKQMIQEATEEIHFQTYIFIHDDIGHRVLLDLAQAAQRGVRVYLLLDHFGSFFFSKAAQEFLHKHGIAFRFFNPVNLSKRIAVGRRLHHKVVVVDNRKALIGGINIGRKYIKEEKNARYPWLDFALYVEGSVTHDIVETCRYYWEEEGSDILSLLVGTRIFNANPLHPRQNFSYVRVRDNDWRRRRSKIHFSYLEAITHAKESISIVGGYFFPGIRIKKALYHAAKRGVRVRLILTQESDFPLQMWATQFIYQRLMQHGIDIYEWKHSVVHGKMAIVDHKWVTIGSYNLNFIERFGNVEMNLDVYDPDFARKVEFELDHLILKGCRYIEPRDWNSLVGYIHLGCLWCCYVLVRWLAVFSINLLVRKKDENT